MWDIGSVTVLPRASIACRRGLFSVAQIFGVAKQGARMHGGVVGRRPTDAVDIGVRRVLLREFDRRLGDTLWSFEA
eukprot:9840274-Lingulodinium_polyedra.AAC.1